MNDKVRELMVQARKAKKIFQEEIAEKMGVSKSAVSSWELGKNDINMEDFTKYCSICGVSFIDILREVYGDPSEPRQKIECTMPEVELIRKWRSLDADAQRRIMRVVNGECEDAERNLAKDTSTVAGTG